MNDKLITSKVVCEMLGVKSTRTIFNWIKNKGFPSPAIRSKPNYFSFNDVQDWIERQKVA